MARSKKRYGDREREQALALYAVSGNITEVAEKLGMPRTTVQSWVMKGEGDVDMSEVRRKQKEKFVAEAWQVIADAQAVISRRISRALDSEAAIDRLIEQVEAMPDVELSRDARGNLIRKLQAIRLDDLSKVAVVMGTMYDKAALASREATAIVDGSLKFEEF